MEEMFRGNWNRAVFVIWERDRRILQRTSSLSLREWKDYMICCRYLSMCSASRIDGSSLCFFKAIVLHIQEYQKIFIQLKQRKMSPNVLTLGELRALSIPGSCPLDRCVFFFVVAGEQDTFIL